MLLQIKVHQSIRSFTAYTQKIYDDGHIVDIITYVILYNIHNNRLYIIFMLSNFQAVYSVPERAASNFYILRSICSFGRLVVIAKLNISIYIYVIVTFSSRIAVLLM